MRAVRYLAFSRRPALLAGRKPGGLPVPVHEVSKRALGSQTTQARPRLAFAPRTVLPSASLKSVGVLIAYFRSSIPSPPVPLFMLHQVLHNTLCKTRGRVVRYSFLVRLFHSLLHAGLSRRTQRTQEPAFLNARTNDAPGIREMEEFDITNLAAPNADRGSPRIWTRALCAVVGAPVFRGCGTNLFPCNSDTQ